jgi:hypothetical protein
MPPSGQAPRRCRPQSPIGQPASTLSRPPGDLAGGIGPGSDTTCGSATTASTIWCFADHPCGPAAILSIVLTIPGRRPVLIATES